MNDYILRGIIDDSISVFIADSTHTVDTARQIHSTSPVASAALGRMLTAAAIMGCMQKNDQDILTLSVLGDGPLRGVVVTSDSRSRVKGYVYENEVDIPLKENGKLDVAGAIGEGRLHVIKDIGLKEPYFGQVPLVSGEIAEDLTYYFAKSEQTPSAVSLGVLVDIDYSVKRAGGFILQVMPGADDEMIGHIEGVVQGFPSMTSLLDDGKTPEDIFEMLAGGIRHKILDTVPISYYCNCTRERVTKALISVGREELTNMINEDKKAEMHCHFCNKDYLFGESELREILLQSS